MAVCNELILKTLKFLLAHCFICIAFVSVFVVAGNGIVFGIDFGQSGLQHGFTALIWAAERGRAECVRLLIDAGTDKEAKTHVRAGRCFAWRLLVIFLFIIIDSSCQSLFSFQIFFYLLYF